MRVAVTLALVVGLALPCAANPVVIHRLGQSFVDSLEVVQPVVPEEEYVLTEFVVSEACRLYFHGERLRLVRITSAPGDTLRLNGKPWDPPRGAGVGARPYGSLLPGSADAVFESVYAEIPFVAEQLGSGADVEDAVAMYEYEQWKLARRLLNQYVSERANGTSVEAARDAALEAIPSLDESELTDSSVEPELIDGELVFEWEGVGQQWRQQRVPLTTRFGVLPLLPYEGWLQRPVLILNQIPSAREKWERADRLSSMTSASQARRPCLHFIRVGATHSQVTTEAAVEAFDEHLSQARATGVLPEDVPYRRDIEQILEYERSRLSN